MNRSFKGLLKKLRKHSFELSQNSIRKAKEIGSTDISKNLNLRKLEVNSTTFANLSIYGLIAFIMLPIEQVRTMLFYNVKNIGIDPIITTLWMCTLSFAIFSYSKFVGIRRNNILRKRIFGDEKSSLSKEEKLLYIPRINRDSIWNLLFYLLPIIFQLGLLVYSLRKRDEREITSILEYYIVSFLIIGIYSTVFIMATFFVKNDWGSSWSKLRYFSRRNVYYVNSLFILTMVAIPIYYCQTHHQNFKGNLGIGFFDVIILLLIFLRGLFAFVYYLYYKSPPLKEIFNIRAYSNIKTNTWIPVSSPVCLAILLGTLLILFQTIYPINYLIRPVTKVVAIKNTKKINAPKNYIKRLSLSDYTKKWMISDRDDGDPIYLVAGQGGGSRAGFWTSSALSRFHTISLDNEGVSSSFYKNCFAISTVSGSSTGASIYLNTVKNYPTNVSEKLTNDNLIKFYEQDYISSSIFRLIFINPIQKFFPFMTRHGRNDQLILEEKLKYHEIFGEASSDKSSNFHDYDNYMPYYTNIDDTEVTEPLFILNTYNVDKRQKSIISPLMISEEYPHEDFVGVMLNEDSLRRKGAPEILNQGSAVNLSQMFPIMSASARYDTCHYYDGGVYDNSGLSTVRDIYAVIAPLRDKLLPRSKIIVIYLANSTDKIKIEDNPQSGLKTLVNAASGSIFGAGVSRHVDKFMKSALQMGDTLITSIANPDVITLNRWLSKSDCDTMDIRLRGLIKSNNFLVKLLKNERVNDSDLVRRKLPKSHRYSIYFDTNKCNLNALSIKTMKSLLSGIRPNKINLYAYADSTGSASYNLDLSGNRANVIKDYIVKYHDIIADKVEVDTIGMCGSLTPHSKQHNRRVDIEFTFYEESGRYYTQSFSSN